MSFDAERLRHWQVPEVVQELTRRDSALYALSTGFGDDPMERADLAFVDPNAPAMRASPSMALVLAYPGFWIADPGLGVDAARVLHIDQSVALDGAVPVEGRIFGRTTILDVIDRGAGRGALVISERILSHDDRIFARLRQTLLLRSEGGFAATRVELPAREPMPDPPADREIEITVPRNAALLYRLNGDYNPLHSDPGLAARAGFERPILHGMGTFGFVTRAILRELHSGPPAPLASIAMRFTAPAFPGDVWRLALWESGAFALFGSDGHRIVEGRWSGSR